MKRLLTHQSYLVLFLLCVACTDEDPTHPMLGEPVAYVAPNTGENCVPGCLRDDIPGWNVIGLTTSGRRIELVDVYDPTTRGEVVDATYCWYRSSDNYFLGCQDPAYWTTGHAGTPDGKVTITGYDIGGYARVRFTGYAPLPQVQLLEYERPAQPTCSGSSMIYCYGTYRLKVSIRNAGWYNTDRLTAFGENAAGQRWELSDVGHVVHYGDETVEWNWTQVHPGTPGSRIVIAYYPWSGSYAGRHEVSVPLYDASPELSLDAMEAPMAAPEASGPMAILVESGTEVVFKPQAPGSLIEMIGWTWTPADTTGARTEACVSGANPCQVPVFEDGTMKVTARVDGQIQTAIATISMAPELVVTASPDRILAGTMVNFRADAIGGNAIDLSWRWNPDSANATTWTCSPGQASCDIAVQESGWMVATGDVGGVACADSAYVVLRCNFFQTPAPQELLRDAMVQDTLEFLWAQTNGGNPLTGTEQGGYFIQRQSGLYFHRFSATGQHDLCGISRGVNEDQQIEDWPYAPDGTYVGSGQIVGVVHTHPLNAGHHTNYGRCGVPPRPGNFINVGDGASTGDLRHLRNLRNMGRNVPMFIVDPNEVWWYRYEGTDIKHDQLPRDLTCVA